MNNATLSLAALEDLLSPAAQACDCAFPEQLPNSFCATIDSTEAYSPATVVLAVKLDQIAYGMRIKVLQVFQGTAAAGDTLMVWGDNGACCRWPVYYRDNGDTILWHLKPTDFIGNWIAPLEPDLEMPGDYCINLCGVYWLYYANGVVSNSSTGNCNGPWIVPGINSMPVNEFWAAVSACVALGIPSPGVLEQLSVRTPSGGVWLALPTGENVDLRLLDAMGKALLRRRWNGEALWIGDLAGGAFLLEVVKNGQRGALKLLIP
jgi:hypothetical protein